MNDKDMGGQLSRQIMVFSVLLASIIIAGIVLFFVFFTDAEPLVLSSLKATTATTP